MNSHTDGPSTVPQGKAAEIPPIPTGVSLINLENGLTLIICEDHSAPVVSAQAWSRAGSIDEGPWLGGGLSHVLEHMLFKGTSTRATGRIDQEIQDAGGYMNAYTSFDRTVYWINVPNTGASVAIDILCDIVQNATLPEEEMDKEKQVILREMDMSHDDPAQRSARRLFETAYTRSPYRFPIIGYPDIYNAVRREDVLAYYREKYAPNNLFLVVAGDVNPAQIETQVRASFAQAKTRPIPLSVIPEEPRQTAPRELIEEAPIELGHLHFSWHIPDLRHPDVPLVDVLATLLGNGRSSRLYQQVREKKGLVHAVDAWVYSPGNPGLIGMSAVVDAEKFAEACQAMLDEVERMKELSVSPQELSKAVKQFTAATLASRKTMQGQAQDLGGNWIAAGDLNFSARYLEAVKRATPADLQRVARQYLTEENRTLYALLPTGSRPRLAAVVSTAVDQPITKFELPNGLRLLVKEDYRLPFVEFRLLFKGGVLAETPPENGLTLLMSKMLLQGTSQRTAEEIASAIESIGGQIDSYAANNSFGVSAEVLSGDFELGLNLLAEVLLQPAFPLNPLERERQIQLATIRAQRDELLASAFHLMRQGLFGETGYGMQAIGTENSVRSLLASHLQHFHHRLVRPNNCVLAVFGHVKSETALASVTDLLGQWAPGEGMLEPSQVTPSLTQRKRLVETREKKQAVLVIGFPGCSVYSPERYALELLQEACSDLGSRLFIRIRDELGLAYYVGAQNMLGLVPGFFAFYAGTAPEKAALVEEHLLHETEKLMKQGLTQEELNRAKAKIIGQRKIARQDLGSYATAVGLDELYGLGFQHHEEEDAKYEAVSLEDIQRAAHQHLRIEASVLSILSPEKTSA
jgi:zinc protease